MSCITRPHCYAIFMASSLWLAAVGTALAQPSVAPLAGPDAAVRAVASIGITVSDLERALSFYTQILPFEKVSESEDAGPRLEALSGVFGARCRVARLRLGDEFIELTQYLAPEGRPIPADSRSNDRWFQHVAIVVSDMDKAYAHLREHQVRHASSGPQTLPGWNPNAGGISAFYFKDPDGHVLEVIHFPAGKGDPRWQHAGGGLFLGIDHTAIVVADTDRSLRFYRDTLGMRIAGESENYGTEQEHLNNVFGARLRITALRAKEGPGVELLEYLAPTDGRPFPQDAHSNDLIGWTTTLITPSAEGLSQGLRAAHVSWISPGLVGSAQGTATWTMAAEVRDPDGHAILIAQPGAAPERTAAAAADPKSQGEGP